MALFKKFMIKEDPTWDGSRDIVDNLNNILNTKKGYGSILDDYGIRDLNEFRDKEGITDVIVEEVIRCVAKYEPRVKIIQVDKEKGSGLFQLSFNIQCMIRETRQSMNMVFDTVGSQFTIKKGKNR